MLALVGGLVANTAQTNGGNIENSKFSLPTSVRSMMTGLLYVPLTPPAKTSACGVLAIGGHIKSFDAINGFSIEVARRGCSARAELQRIERNQLVLSSASVLRLHSSRISSIGMERWSMVLRPPDDNPSLADSVIGAPE